MHDAIALVVPADAYPAETAPVKHRWATESDSHLSNGTGSIRCGILAALCLLIAHPVMSLHAASQK